MGEYAKRNSDRQEVKIGTCESMYYLRYEDRNEVTRLEGNVNPATVQNCFWRLPFPDEDRVKIGEYKEYKRGLKLYTQHEDRSYSDWSDAETANDPGTIQFHNESGMLINVKCYHGIKLPEVSADFKPFWNGKSWFFELVSVKNTAEGVKAIVHCRHCGQMWRYEWADILPYVNGEIKERLQKYDPFHGYINEVGEVFDENTGQYHYS